MFHGNFSFKKLFSFLLQNIATAFQSILKMAKIFDSLYESRLFNRTEIFLTSACIMCMQIVHAIYRMECMKKL